MKQGHKSIAQGGRRQGTRREKTLEGSLDGRLSLPGYRKVQWLLVSDEGLSGQQRYLRLPRIDCDTKFKAIHHKPQRPVLSTAAASLAARCAGTSALLAFHVAALSITLTLHGITIVEETSRRVLPVLAMVITDRVKPALRR